MKKTSIERFWEEICMILPYSVDSDICMKMHMEFERYKEVYKREIIDAVNQTEFEDTDGYGITETITKGEQYYQEKYKR